VFSLGATTNPEEVAKKLYEVLRYLDREGIKEAWVDMEFPSDGLWKTIGERLRKASAKQTA
jgi:L-threonylcarbamoyladenylate synthase